VEIEAGGSRDVRPEGVEMGGEREWGFRPEGVEITPEEYAEKQRRHVVI
jgi:hypothetical protein